MIVEPHLPGQLSAPVWTGRGTAGLVTLLLDMVPAGSGVLVPVNLCAIAVKGIEWAGMRPVFHDVSPRHGNAELLHLQQAYDEGCRVVLAVHNFGRPLPIVEFIGWAKQQKLLLIEDVCNALGATCDGQPVGHFGDAALYSFNHSKIVDLGGGGAVTVRDEKTRDRVAARMAVMPAPTGDTDAAAARLERGLRGARSDDDSSEQCRLYDDYRPFALSGPQPHLAHRVDEVLTNLERNVAHRRAIARLYRQRITIAEVEHVDEAAGEVPWRHNILAPPDRRDALLAHLREHGVPASAWYPPVARLAAAGNPGCFPGADRFARRVINLWVDLTITADEASHTSRLIEAFFGGDV